MRAAFVSRSHWHAFRCLQGTARSPGQGEDGMEMMKAVVFGGVGNLRLQEVPKPQPGPGEAVLRVTATTICGTDVHIVKGEYPVREGLIPGHEPVGVIDTLGPGLENEFTVGQRVIVGAITPCGQCFYCLNAAHAQCGGALGGWRFGNTINGAWAEYLLVPHARANLAVVPPDLSDEQVLMLPDIASTGISGAESGNVRIGDSVAVFAQGPIGLCATLGAKLRGASLVVGVDPLAGRREVAERFGASVTLDPTTDDVVARLRDLTGGRGVDVAIEALGRQTTFESALRSIRPGGVLSSLGVYSGKLVAPYEALYAGLGNQQIVTTLCPGGKERMRRLIALVAERRVDLTPLITHRFALEDIHEAYDLFSRQGDGVLKVALFPAAIPDHRRSLTTDRVESVVPA
jgi:alcohol dehydrogenase